MSRLLWRMGSNSHQRVLLLDAYNLLYRGFTSLPLAILARDGRPINAVYGLLSTVIRLATEHAPTHLAAAFDMPDVPTFRTELYPPYQQQRGPLGGELADEFARQAEIAFTILPSLGIAAIRAPRYEADDVIGTLALQVAQAGGRALIVSTDRDVLQLVRPGIAVVPPGRGLPIIEDGEAVRQKIGVLPERVTDFKALAGDASDNVPGLPGIGVKTAAKLVEEFGPLEDIYTNLQDLPKRTAAILEANRSVALLYRDLVTIVTDVKLPVSPATLPAMMLDASSRVRDLLDGVGYGRPESTSGDGE